jgi:Ca-activated chloride channel family protein
MSEFHFLRPEWLVALPLALAVAWFLLGGRRGRGGWHAVVDTALQPFVLVRAGAARGRRLPLVLAALAAVLGVLALAGPTWERVPVPAFRSDEALVVAIDLSRSMDAGDLEPSRLARAKLKLLSLLERRTSGQTGLVVFTAHAFTVTPLTTDTRTVGALVNALTSDIMPSRGSYIEAGLAKAAALLSQAGATRGDVLVMTDAEVSRASLDLAAELRGEGYTVHVLAAGTEDGAPIPEATGGFLTDRSGQVVIPRVDLEALARLADVGGGRFAQMTADDRDLARLFPAGDAGEVVDAGAEEYAADVWRDQGVWLVLALLPLAALAFRRGWVYVALVVLALPAERARAFEWRDLWERPDQQGIEAIESGDPARASDLFDDPRWRAAAQYRAGEFAASAASLAPLSTVTDFYNTGNALAKSGQLEAAIGAYDRALELDPSHDDARYNRELVEDLLEQQQQQQQQQNEQQQNEESGESGESQEQASSSDQSSESQGEQSESDDERQSTADSEQRDPGDEERDGDEQQDETGEPPDEPRQVAAASPEDIEEWADEQAAEQWLRRIPQDPGGLLRRKFLYQYQRLGRDQEGNYVWPGDEAKPW